MAESQRVQRLKANSLCPLRRESVEGQQSLQEYSGFRSWTSIKLEGRISAYEYSGQRKLIHPFHKDLICSLGWPRIYSLHDSAFQGVGSWVYTTVICRGAYFTKAIASYTRFLPFSSTPPQGIVLLCLTLLHLRKFGRGTNIQPVIMVAILIKSSRPSASLPWFL